MQDFLWISLQLTKLSPKQLNKIGEGRNARGMDIVGIYRVSGNSTVVSYLTEQVRKGVEKFSLGDQCWQDIVSSLLKYFFLFSQWRSAPHLLYQMCKIRHYAWK